MAGKKNPSIASLWSSGGRLVRQWSWFLLLAGSFFYGGVALSVHGQGTAAFSYQGRLNASGSPAQGNFDFQFSLMNQESSGSNIGEILQLDDVEVSDGLFSVSLDFGFGAFGGNPRWLEISVRASGSGLDFTTLTPRQRITAVPYALFATTPAGPIGPSGATGPVGPQGPAGPPGPAGGGTLADVAAGVSVSSQIAADPELTTLGFQQIASVPAPNWVSGSVANQPAARERHSIVWTGTELLVWGGVGASHSPLSTGARYDGASDLWTPISPIDAPSGRSDHSGIWSGDKLLIWGGFGASGYLASGGIYDPDRQTWASVSTVNAPIARSEHAAVWNGRMMIVWGGQNDAGLLSDGAMYDPETSTWFPLNLPGAPLARRAATGVWTGDRLIVWGGEGGNRELGDGAQLVFDANGVPLGWQAVSGIAAPVARRGHSAIWTGTRLLVWGGSRGGSFLNDGGSYDPISDVWTPISSVSAPVGRRFHGSVWTGSEMIVWAGDGAGGALASGGAYSPTNDTWRPLTNGGAPTARSRFGVAWSGNELLVFGGTSTGGVVGALERVAPQPTWYFYRKP